MVQYTLIWSSWRWFCCVYSRRAFLSTLCPTFCTSFSRSSPSAPPDGSSFCPLVLSAVDSPTHDQSISPTSMVETKRLALLYNNKVSGGMHCSDSSHTIFLRSLSSAWRKLRFIILKQCSIMPGTFKKKLHLTKEEMVWYRGWFRSVILCTTQERLALPLPFHVSSSEWTRFGSGWLD